MTLSPFLGQRRQDTNGSVIGKSPERLSTIADRSKLRDCLVQLKADCLFSFAIISIVFQHLYFYIRS